MSLLPSPIPHPMSLLPFECPDWAKGLLEFAVGVDWPEGDEAAMRHLADEWYEAARQLPPLLEDADVATLEAVAAFGGPDAQVAAAMLALWRKIGEGPEAALSTVAAVMGMFGEAVGAGANEIEGVKIEFYIELLILLIELLILAATAAVTFGGSAAAAGPAVMVTRFAISQLLKRAAKELAENAVKKGIKDKIEDLVKDKIEDKLKSRLSKFAFRSGVDGVQEGAQELATSALTQGYQIIEGNRQRLDGKDLVTSFGLGTLGGSVAGLSSIGGLKTKSLTGNLGEHVLRGAGGEMLAEVSVSVVTGQGVSVQDLGRAATSSALGTSVDSAQHVATAKLVELNASEAFGTVPAAGEVSSADVVVASSGSAVTVPAQGSSLPDVGLAGAAPGGEIAAVSAGGQASTAAAASVAVEGGSVPSATTVAGSGSAAVAADPATAPTSSSVGSSHSAALTSSVTATPSVVTEPSHATPAASVAASTAPSSTTASSTSVSPGGTVAPPPAVPGAAVPSTGSGSAPVPLVPAGHRSPAAHPGGVVGRPLDPAGAPAGDPPQPEVPGAHRSVTPSQGGLGRPVDPAGGPVDGLPPALVPLVVPGTSQPSSPVWSGSPPGFTPLLGEDTEERRAYADEVLILVRRRIEAELNQLVDDLIDEAQERRRDLLRLMDDAPDENWRRDLDDLYTAELRRIGRLREEGRFALSEAEVRKMSDRIFEIAQREVMGGRFRTVDGGLNDDSRRSQATGADVPPPVEATRRYGQRGGYVPPLALHQQDVELAVARDGDGRTVRFPDLFGPWPALANDGGPYADPARAINCVDVVLSVLDTWLHGRPRVAAPRTFDAVSLDAELRPLGGEPGGAARIEQATGGVFQSVSPSRDGLAYVEQALRRAGHGACAVLIQEMPNGRAHATTVHNQHGQMVYVDAQMSHDPVQLHRPLGAVRMDVLVLDPDARPVDIGTPPGAWSNRSASATSEMMLQDASPAQLRVLCLGATSLADLGFRSMTDLRGPDSGRLAEALPITAMLDPRKLLYSQRSVPPARTVASDGGGEQVVTSVGMETEMRLHGWRGAPIHAVRWGNGSIAGVDNQQLRAARRAGLERIPVAVHQPSDPLGDWPQTLAGADAIKRLTVDIRRLPSGVLTAGGDVGKVVYQRGSVPQTWGELAMFQAADQQSLLQGDLFGTHQEPVLLPDPPGREKAPRLPEEIRERLHRLREAADGAADRVQGDLQALGHPLHGTEHRIKSQESLERKFVDEGDRFARDLDRFTAEHANDVLRFSVVLPDGEGYVAALDAALDTLRGQGYDVVAEKNFWQPGNRYYGFNATLRSPNGQLFEVQFPTPTSLHAGSLTHQFYETVRREDELPVRRVHALLRMLAINQQLDLPRRVPLGLGDRNRPANGGLAKWITEHETAWHEFREWLDYHGRSFAEIAAEFGLTGDDFPISHQLTETDDAVLRALQPRLRLGEERTAGGADNRSQSLWAEPGELCVPRDPLESLGEDLEVRPPGQRQGQEQRHLHGSNQTDISRGGGGDSSGDHEGGAVAERGDDHVDLPVEGESATAPRPVTERSWDDVAHLLPADIDGHQTTPEQCESLGITPDQVARWAARQAPLGLTPEQYDTLRDGLAGALAGNGIDPSTVDARMAGSSARFFAGPHKSFPTPEQIEMQAPGMLHRFEQSRGEHPRRWPFDSMHQLGFDHEPSDYDLHLSSDAMVTRVEQIRRLFFPGHELYHKEYKFVDKPSMELAFPDLHQWAQLESRTLRRSVSLTLFASSGPPDTSGPDRTGTSPHFRDGDWVVNLPAHEPRHAAATVTGRVATAQFDLEMTQPRLDALRSALGLAPRGRLGDDWDMKLGEGRIVVNGQRVRVQLWRTAEAGRWQIIVHGGDLSDAALAPVLDRVNAALASDLDPSSLATPPPDPQGRPSNAPDRRPNHPPDPTGAFFAPRPSDQPDGYEAAMLDDVYERAALAADRIMADFTDVATTVEGDLRDTEYRVKSRDSLERKYLDEGRQFGPERFAARVNDSVRFLIVLPEGDRYRFALHTAIGELERRGYELAAEPKRFWLQGNRFYGTNASFRAPDGTLFEVQFPTDLSYRVWHETHQDYEIVRDIAADAEERVRALLRMLEANRQLGMIDSIPLGMNDEGAKDNGLAKWIADNPGMWKEFRQQLVVDGRSFADVLVEYELEPEDIPVTPVVAAKLEGIDADLLGDLRQRHRGPSGSGTSRPVDRGRLDGLDHLRPSGEGMEIRSGDRPIVDDGLAD